MVQTEQVRMSDIEARVKIENAMRINYSDEQWEVVSDSKRPSSVVSCAGSGKTTVLIARLLYKELVEGIKPYRILVITFNKKASEEVEERYQRARRKIGLPNFMPSFYTFHAFFLRLLRTDSKYEDFTVTNSNKYLYILSDLVKTHQTLKANVDLVKDILATRSYGINNKKDFMTHNEFGEMGRSVITKYEEMLAENNELDFDDMLLLLYRELFEFNNQEIIQTFKESFDMVMIDEFQDISGIQYDIIEELTLAIGMDKLTAIGDDDQCIYEFRGSNPRYITQFGNMLPSAKTHLLTVNFRCPREILAFVAPSIYKNSKRVAKALQTSRDGGDVHFLGVKEDEPLVQALVNDYRLNKSVAVLVRNNHQKTVISDRLMRKGVPVDMGSSNYTVKNNQVFKKLTMFIDMIRESDNNNFIKYYWMFDVSRNQVQAIKTRYRGTDEFWVEDVLENDMWDIPYSMKRIIRTMLQEDNAEKLYKHAMSFFYDSFRNGAKKGFYNMGAVEDYYHYIVDSIAKDISYTEFKEKINYYQQYVDRNIGNKKAIQVVTMHTVKGLEYDTVVVYDPSDVEMFPEFRGLWEKASQRLGKNLKDFRKMVFSYDKRSLELLAMLANDSGSNKMTAEDVKDRIESERRLYYVACTRAKQTLYVSTDLDRWSTLVMESLAHRGEVEIPLVPVTPFVERNMADVAVEAEIQRETQRLLEEQREKERQARLNRRKQGLSELESLLGNKSKTVELDKTMSLGNIGQILGMEDED